MSTSRVVLKIVSILGSILIFMIVVVGIMKLGTIAYDFGYRIFAEKPVADAAEARNIQVQISSGMSAKEIGELLEEKGLIRSQTLFLVQLKVSDYNSSIKPGLYTLSTGQTAEEMMAVMSSANANEEKKQE